ncbi:LysR substrate-binding domain-containing protein [Variovorax paradoxus]|uniref:HTH-type transcriptional regulator DmlR n=1 Tax=Variovorax paradoxus TaxID=34073 RepID=A0A0H2MKR2_VARPD|nr:LysR substrate-binding domain-containing protein [Variovorax paradoxus]KLN57380.1 HTH-type transcriptional regulator DmlR [Variovorax paradoxus]
MNELNGVVDDLLALVLVVEAGGFNAASMRHNIPVSRLSRRIASLEKRLGVSLLVRSSRRFRVTEIGERMVQHGLAIRAETRSALSVAQDALNEPAGHLRVSCPISMATSFVGGLCLEFVKRHPKVALTLDSTDGRPSPSSEAADLLIRPVIDTLPDSSMVSRKLGDFPYALVGTPALHESLGRPATPQALAALPGGCPAIGWTFSPHPSRWLLRGPGNAKAELDVKPRFTSDSLPQIHQAALAGIGIARLPLALCAADLEQGRLCLLAPGWAPPTISMYALYPSRRDLTLAGRQFLAMLAETTKPYLKT